MLFVVALSVLAAAPTEGGANPYLDQVQEDFARLEYAKCLEHLRLGASWRNTTRELVALELYGGLCEFSLRREPEAAEHFRLALRIDRDAELPSMVSPKIRTFFEKIRSELPPAPKEPESKEVEPPSDPKRQPDAPLATELTPKPPPAVAAPILEPARPNRTLPYALAGTAAAATALGIYFGVSAKDYERRSRSDRFEVDIQADGRAARDLALAANVSYGLAIAAATGAVVSWVAGTVTDEGAPGSQPAR